MHFVEITPNIDQTWSFSIVSAFIFCVLFRFRFVTFQQEISFWLRFRLIMSCVTLLRSAVFSRFSQVYVSLHKKSRFSINYIFVTTFSPDCYLHHLFPPFPSPAPYLRIYKKRLLQKRNSLFEFHPAHGKYAHSIFTLAIPKTPLH